MDIDPGQVTAVAGQTLHTVAGLSPMAQIAAVIMLGIVGLAWIGKSYVPLMQARKRDAETGSDDVRAIIGALTEYATTMEHMVKHSEKMTEHVGVVAGSMGKAVELMMLIVAEMPGITHEKAERLFRELEEHRAALSEHARRKAA